MELVAAVAFVVANPTATGYSHHNCWVAYPPAAAAAVVVVMVVQHQHQVVVEEERCIHSENNPAVAAENFVAAFVLPEEIACRVVAPAAVMDHIADKADPEAEEVEYQAVARPVEEEEVVVGYRVVVVVHHPLQHHPPHHHFLPTLHPTPQHSSHVLPPSSATSFQCVAVPIQHLVHLLFHWDPNLMHALPIALLLQPGFHLVLRLVILITFEAFH
mmetsp:Transcript_28228/g.44430  ORF Transcript_28228/g.44430 Transcript_28228/m.44430 type:complete len:216 (+) Transcript_28228:1267-1914(+)